MKKSVFLRVLAIGIAMLMIISCLQSALYVFATPAEDKHFQFGSDGNFRILNFSDFQEDTTLDSRVKSFIRQAVTEAEPDLIVLTGDNIYGGYMSTDNYNDTYTAINEYMGVLEEMGVPVAIVFGNHDDEGNALSKENQMLIYDYYSVNISYDEGSSMSGCGTYNVPIYSSTDSSKVAFNLWMFDTGSNPITGYYDAMRDDQLAWFTSKSNELNAANGGVDVPSIAFQHIVVKEIYDALDQVPAGTAGAIERNGNYYVLPSTAVEGSQLNEAPCPATYGNEFSVLSARGSVKAIVSGHDHINEFIIPYGGLDLIATPSCGFLEYGSDYLRGARIIDIDEQTGDYTTEMLRLKDYAKYHEYTTVGGTSMYVKDVALCYFQEKNNGSLDGAVNAAQGCIYSSVDAVNGNGICIEADINSGSVTLSESGNHVVVYSGYTYTTNASEALRGLATYYGENSSSTAPDYSSSGYYLCNSGDHFVAGTDGAVNLNYGTAGPAIYLYGVYGDSGETVSDIVVAAGDSAITITDNYYSVNGTYYIKDEGWKLVYPLAGKYTGEAYADLNSGASGDYVYMLYKTGVKTARAELDSSYLRAAWINAKKYLDKPLGYYDASLVSTLQGYYDTVTAAINDLNDDGIVDFTQSDIDEYTNYLNSTMASMTKQSYTIKFYDDLGTTVLYAVDVEYGGTAVYNGSAPNKESDEYYTYTFSKWVTDQNGNTEADLTNIIGSVNVYAKFTADARKYNITLNTNGGTVNSGNVTEYTYGVGEMLPSDVTRDGYLFLGWYDNIGLNGTAVTSVSGSQTGNKEYWAKWENAVIYSDAVISVSSIENVVIGGTFDVTVDIANNPGLTALAFNVSYDSDYLALVSVTDGRIFGTGNLTVGSISANPCSVTWSDTSAAVNYNGNGTLCTLKFRVIGAQAGTTVISLDFDQQSTYNIDKRQIYLTTQNGTAGILISGDADSDSVVTLKDVVAIKRWIAECGVNMTISEAMSDVNKDGIVDLKDVVLLRRFIAGGWGVELK